MEERAPRLTGHYHIQFGCPEQAGEGMTFNLSTDGLCIITPIVIRAGQRVYARLILWDSSCIEYQIAIVRWCHNGRIGLELSFMEESDRRRLNLLLVELKARVSDKALAA
jgi:hypothetical protein